MDGTYALSTRARGTFFSKKHGYLGLTPVYSETTALSKPYFILKLQSMRKFLLKRLFSRLKKLIRQVTMALKTLFQTKFQNFAVYGGIRSAGCWLSRAVGSQNAVVLMLWKLLLLEGS